MWLREGDKNNKFFHATAKVRRKSNQVTSRLNGEGRDIDWEGGLENLMVEYFKNLFKATDTQWEDVTNCINSKVLTEQNIKMKLPVLKCEVKQALFYMHPDKSPGPDGMSLGFYQQSWSIIKGDIISLVRQFFAAGSFDHHLTETNIVLVPKKKNPQYMTELRPISMYRTR